MKIYNHGIHIVPNEGMALANATPMNKKDAQAFEEHVTKCLDRLRSVSSGKKIVNEIGSSNHVCTIFCAPRGLKLDQNVAKQNPPSMANEIAAMHVSFRPRHKNLLMKQKEKTVGQVNQFLVDFKQEMTAIGQDQTRAQAAPELFRILTRCKSKYPQPFNDLARLLGINARTFADMCTGDAKIDDKTYFTLVFHLYDFLTPGPGTDTYVRFQSYDSFKRDFSDDFDTIDNSHSSDRAWRNLASTILGHELIHAWRMMKGKRAVMGGAWEEEAMTTGVGPFVNWTPTENTLRAEFKLPHRAKYQSGSCASDMMSGIMMNMNWGGTVNERF